MTFSRIAPLSLSAAIAACLAVPATAATFLPEFAAATFQSGAPVTNRFFPVDPGTVSILVAKGENSDGAYDERSEHSALAGGPVILGVATLTVLDRAYDNGLLVEETQDFYAEDSLGNVWYFGEDVTNYRYDDAGNLTGTDNKSAWRAGVAGAVPGIIMPAAPQAGQAYYQEFAAANGALDEALVQATGQVLNIGDRTFSDVLVTFESTSLDPAAREVKYYAPGVGMIRVDESVDAAFANPRVTFVLQATAP